MSNKRGESTAALEAYGLDRVCEDILNERNLKTIAKAAGSSLARLLAWIEADKVRSARVREARVAMAKVWDEKAEEVISNAKSDFGLRKAKELSHHFRWRASRIAPREYGASVALSGAGGGPIEVAQVDPSKLSNEVLAALMAARKRSDRE